MGRDDAPHDSIRAREVHVRAGDVNVSGSLSIPGDAKGIVLFAHGSGSSRHSPRNQLVAEALQRARLGTLLMDLLTPEEDAVDRLTRTHRFDIPLLGDRLTRAIDWLGEEAATRDFPVGLFGASTGAAAALRAAAARPHRVFAVVSRGGRPDLAGDSLARVQAPTLLIVGAHDAPVIPLNEAAQRRMRAPVELALIPGASHLFEEPGALAAAAALARNWFLRHLPSPPGPAEGLPERSG